MASKEKVKMEISRGKYVESLELKSESLFSLIYIELWKSSIFEVNEEKRKMQQKKHPNSNEP